MNARERRRQRQRRARRLEKWRSKRAEELSDRILGALAILRVYPVPYSSTTGATNEVSSNPWISVRRGR